MRRWDGQDWAAVVFLMLLAFAAEVLVAMALTGLTLGREVG